MILVLLTFLVLFAQTQSESSLILQYFTKIKPVHHVVAFTCEPALQLQGLLSTHGIFAVNFARSEEMETLNITNILIKEATDPWGVFVESECHLDILQQASQWEHFNSSYFWLVQTDSLDVLNQVYHIGLNSQLTVLLNNELVDVFSHGRHLEFNLTLTRFAIWDDAAREIVTERKLPELYRKNYRGNFNGLTLRQAVVHAQRLKNWTIEGYDRLMDDKKAPGTLMLVKFHHNLGRLLKDLYNFKTRVNRVARDLNGVYIRGIRPGGLGILKRNESDVSSTGAIPFLCRIDEFDFLHTRLMFSADLFYRLTPDLAQNSGKITFLVPFSTRVWQVLFVLMLLLSVSFFVTYFLWFRRLEGSLAVLQVTEVFTGQGLHYEIRQNRLIAIVSIFCFILVMNFYGSQLLNVLLTPQSDKIHDADQLLRTGIKTNCASTFGIRLELMSRFNKSGRRYEEVFFEKGPSEWNRGPRVVIFNNHETGIKLVRTGGLAYCGESSSLQSFIKKDFSPDEICETRKQPILLHPQYHVLKKNSQYTQAFMIGLLKADEVGLLHRVRNQFYDDMPPCLAGVKLYSVEFAKVKGAFYILMGGMAASCVVFLIESRSRFRFSVPVNVYHFRTELN